MSVTVTKSLVEVWGETGANLSYRVYADKDTPLTDWISDALTEFPTGSGVYVGEHEGWDVTWSGFILYTDAADPTTPITGDVFDADEFDPMYAASLVGIGTGDTAVSSDSGGAANLSYTYMGAGVGNGIVRAYLQSEFTDGDFIVRDQTSTQDDGHWLSPMYLNSGSTYTLVYNKPGVYAASRKDYTVP